MKKIKKYVVLTLLVGQLGIMGTKTLASELDDNQNQENRWENHEANHLIDTIGERARLLGQENDLYASVMIAQAILESGNGQSVLAQSPNYNLFGLKGSYGQESVFYYVSDDSENPDKIEFRKYSNYQESMADYVSLLNNGTEENGDLFSGAHKKEAETFEMATASLKTSYSTDKLYDQKLNEIIESNNLTRFDQWEIQPLDVQEEVVFDSTSTFILPVEGYSISSPFGNRGEEHHDGIDLAMAENSPVKAAKNGTVVDTGFNSSTGNYVIIQHEDNLFTSYFHLNSINTTSGEIVTAGQLIGLVGSTGNSTGSHLHFGVSTEMWQGYLDPASYLNF
ncbi:MULTISPECIES: peptidoglycan DD-metalloendopeptidase family protein [Vagococcus]|uniref:Membrane proteins related to metalloendopeptidases n=1 Tax=Vagococcus fluvialis bH819 TaxID=1255619 RepID=A0A1X6WME5_9ENTE|nr:MULTISPECIES: peptidoglycan DD-metalloendopeptidase family protein [Vagococcus]SLM85435.1 Membrane proteins related to metalloendopeptidases [Vagococcus fluvialis bH819]HCM89272.1 hypothetical protein [Vagococcus sp.]